MSKSRWEPHRMAGLGRFFKGYWWERADGTYGTKLRIHIPEGKTPLGEEKKVIGAKGFHSWFLAEEWVYEQAIYYRRKYDLREEKR